MIIYFADRQLNILGQASTELPEGLTVISDTKTEEVENGVNIFECFIPFKESTRLEAERYTEVGNYLLRSADGENEFYTIIEAEIDTQRQEIYIYAEDAGMDLINEVFGEFEADKAYSIDYYIKHFAGDSGFELSKINEAKGLTRKLKWDGEATATERLASTAAEFGCEISYTFIIEGLTVTNKYINIHKQRGKDLEIPLRLNKEVSRIVTNKSIANLATALQCEGGVPEDKEEPITLKGYKYDDGDFYVNGSVLYSRKALERWKRYLWINDDTKQAGSHIVKLFDYDTTSQATLCAHAITELKKIREMEVNYEIEVTELPENVKIGDRVNIIDDVGELYLSSRILKLQKSVADQKITATLGEYLLKTSGISEKVEQLAADFAKNTVSVQRAASIANNAVELATNAQAQAEAAAVEVAQATEKAEEAKTAAGTATQAANNAEAQAKAAEAAVNKVEEKVVTIDETANNAIELLREAQQAAEQAQSLADTATAEAETAKAAYEAAQTAADEAQTAFNNVEAAYIEAGRVADEAEATLNAAIADLETIQSRADATETEIAEAQAAVNSAQSAYDAAMLIVSDLGSAISDLIPALEEVVATATAAQAVAEEAAATATAAQELATSKNGVAQALAVEKASLANIAAAQAQETADNARAEADNALIKVNEAEAAIETARATTEAAKATAAQARADLATAENALAEILANAEATEAEVIAAQAEVERANTAKAEAEESAEKAQQAYTEAVTFAENARTAAENAENAATEAQKAVDEITPILDKAVIDVNSLEKRVTTAETSITQNAEEIELRATKKEVTENSQTLTESIINQVKDMIRISITDSSGQSSMTQTTDGWTFDISKLQGTVDKLANTVKVGTYTYTDENGELQEEPAIDLCEADSAFKLKITNTRIIFTDGNNELVTIYSKTQALKAKKIETEELQLGGWVWQARNNGRNIGLVWKGAVN